MAEFSFEHLYSEQVVFVVMPSRGSIIRPFVDSFDLQQCRQPAEPDRDGIRFLRSGVRSFERRGLDYFDRRRRRWSAELAADRHQRNDEPGWGRHAYLRHSQHAAGERDANDPRGSRRPANKP